MPKTPGGSIDGITFIVGNPRSKQNLSKIRRHASKAPKSEIRTTTSVQGSKRVPTSSETTPPAASADGHRSISGSPHLSEPDLPTSSPIQCCTRTFRLSSAESSQHSVPDPAVLKDWNHALSQIKQDAVGNLALPQHQVSAVIQRNTPSASEESESDTLNDEPSVASEACTSDIAISQQRESNLLPLKSTVRSSSFTTVGTALGTWYENHPTMQAAATFDDRFDPHKRARLSSQSNHEGKFDGGISREQDLTGMFPPVGENSHPNDTSTRLVHARSCADVRIENLLRQ